MAKAGRSAPQTERKRLRQYLMIAGGAIVAILVLILIIVNVVGGSKVEKARLDREAKEIHHQV